MSAELVQDLAWLHSGFVGISSRVMWRVMNHESPRQVMAGEAWGYPHDPDDFSRCYLLLQRNPAWRSRIAEMRACGKVWAAFVDHWDELEELFRACTRGAFSEMNYHDRRHWDREACNRMYDRMKALESEATRTPEAQDADR
jgi:hypothetical protein